MIRNIPLEIGTVEASYSNIGTDEERLWITINGELISMDELLNIQAVRESLEDHSANLLEEDNA